MPRPPRIKGNDIHYHIVLRCNNKEHLFQDRTDFEVLLSMLGDARNKFGFRLYNYELLHSHIHLMLSTHDGNFIDQIMHDFCFKYAKDFNQRNGRSGHLWAHRYRSRLILNDQHALACLRYQHRNVLSAAVVSTPEDWPWSGYTFYAFGTPNNLLELHPSFLALEEDESRRRKIYRELVNTSIPADKVSNTIERGNKLLSRRFLMMVNQSNRLLKQIKSTLPYQ